MTAPSYTICRRNGCTLARTRRTQPDGKSRLSSHCSQACIVWDQRAKRALAEGSGDEANELLRLAVKLDARTHPGQTVPGIFVDTRRKAA
ncbi:hypothetical protein K388_00311 [Streptomyces sp. KhCrAH-43]|uniref:hypothetical protein n=1 Tax=unclassified Streptomyces TaxID=2593676 RepID=UPI000373904C|nr:MULTISPECIES: hypothetical protein [unclassified Streptomyces]MYS37901.1 hypothetical protein [Streptomyces sp. SID4920]MYX66088.1 hypothetical protein [Streptomyces sp. SID8373]RAJ67571.1 hypothetical protein K388_00311 [Streptomyces sp. KhCrAH-43]